MRKSTAACLLAFGLLVCAGGLPPKVAGRVVYQEIVLANGTEADIVARAQGWVAANTDRASLKLAGGVVTSKGQITVPPGKMTGQDIPLLMKYTVSVEVMGGRYRYTFIDFVGAGSTTGRPIPLEDAWNKDGSIRTGNTKMLEAVHEKVIALIASLKAAMVKPGKPAW